MYRSLAVLTLLSALVLAGCPSDGTVEPTPDPLSVNDWKVVALSGDQAVPASGASVASSPAGMIAVNADRVGADGYSAEPLIGVIELTPGAQSRGASIDGLPDGTLVHWHLDSEGGTLFGGTTTPDDSLHVLNRWAPSTKAGTYTATAGRLVDGDIVTDETWELVVEPGEVASASWSGGAPMLEPADTLDLAPRLQSAWDKHRNPIPVGEVAESASVTWAIESVAEGRGEYGPCQPGNADAVSGDGWTVVVPDLIPLGFPMRYQAVLWGEPEREQHAWVIHASIRIRIDGRDIGNVGVRQLVGHTDRTDPPTPPAICQ